MKSPNVKQISIVNDQTRAAKRPWSLVLGASLVLGIWNLMVVPCAWAQGNLTPPGAPSPGMKSLDQIEPRTPISSAPFTINAPGSYYLTNNLTVSTGNAITINASGVTLDLNGFAISSTASSPTGVALIVSGNNVVIRNGSVNSGVTVTGGTFSGTGFVNGVSSSGSDLHVIGLGVYGTLGTAIFLGGSNSSIVESCTVNIAGSNGIYASVVRDCSARNTGLGIIADEAFNCDAEAVSSSGNAILTSRAAQNCFGVSTSGFGIASNGTVQNCVGVSNSGYGLSGYTVQNCYGISTSGTGLNGITVTNSYGTNNSSTNPAITATTVHNCYGFNPSGPAISATYSVDNSAGYCGNGTGGINVVSAKNVSNSYAEIAAGNNATGIRADVVQNSSVTVAISGAFGIIATLAEHSKVTLTATGTNFAQAIDIIGEATDCYVLNSGSVSQSTGIVVEGQSIVRNCDVRNTSVGILTTLDDCLIKDNNLVGNTTAVQLSSNNNRLEGNRASCPAGGHAFVVYGNDNLIIRNTTRDNGSNPLIIDANALRTSYGTYISNINGGEITSSNPWANISY